MSYHDALDRYASTGASRADDVALMAAFCAHDIQVLVGAVSPQLVWEGAQKRGLSTRQLAALTANPLDIAELQWL